MFKNKKISLIVCIFVLCISIGSLVAYFADGDTVSNSFIIGNVSTDLKEDTWEIPDDVVPRQVISKDPTITNVGKNAQYVFLEVQIPHGIRMTANEDGTKNKNTDILLFSLDNISPNWCLISSDITDIKKSGYYTYVYAYAKMDGMTTLNPNEVTEPLFTSVTYANIIEDETMEGETYYINITAYAIQDTNINDSKEITDGKNADGKILPQDVWKVIQNQNKEDV